MTNIETDLYKSLQVLLHNQTITGYLRLTDPQALLQCLAAINRAEQAADDWSVEEEQMHERRAHACDR